MKKAQNRPRFRRSQKEGMVPGDCASGAQSSGIMPSVHFTHVSNLINNAMLETERQKGRQRGRQDTALDEEAAGTLLDDMDVEEEGEPAGAPDDDHPGNWNEPIDHALRNGFVA